LTTLTNHQNEIKKLYKLRQDIRNAILGNDYYIARDLKEIELKVINKIKDLEQQLKTMQKVV
jgi:hypothetical protein